MAEANNNGSDNEINDKVDPLQESSIEDQSANRSPGPLRTDISNSTAQNTVARPNASLEDPNINGGPSVGIEDSKFLMESSLNQNSISMPQDSKFSAPKGEQSASRQDDLTTPDMIAVQRTNHKGDDQ